MAIFLTSSMLNVAFLFMGDIFAEQLLGVNFAEQLDGVNFAEQ